MKQQFIKFIYLSLGWLFVGVGTAGIFLPLLPTTPFILLASACFLRGSPTVSAWLFAHPKFGPILKNWHQDKSVEPHVKKRANIFIVLSFCLSIFFVPYISLKIVLLCIMIGLLIWFNRLPDATPVAHTSENT